MIEKRVHVLLLAGGSGSRMGAGKNKVLLSLGGKTVLRRSAEAFICLADDMIVVCRPEDQPESLDVARVPVGIAVRKTVEDDHVFLPVQRFTKLILSLHDIRNKRGVR